MISYLLRIGIVHPFHNAHAQDAAIFLGKRNGERHKGGDLFLHLGGIHAGIITHDIEVFAFQPAHHLKAVRRLSFIDITNGLAQNRSEQERRGLKLVGALYR